jgi:hypothetical protein
MSSKSIKKKVPALISFDSRPITQRNKQQSNSLRKTHKEVSLRETKIFFFVASSRFFAVVTHQTRRDREQHHCAWFEKSFPN